MAAPVKEIQEWFSARIPKEWGDIEVQADDQEVLVVVSIGEPEHHKGASAETKENTRAAHLAQFRESSRDKRVEIASQGESLFNRKVSWGATSGDTSRMFTGLGIPVMTRLRLRERALLDTLVVSGVARSRSEALAWCVRLVSSKQKAWIDELREVTKKVEDVKKRGPGLTTV